MLIAQAYGQHPAISAMEYHIIAGKPSKKSEAMLASFIQAGGKVQWHKLDDTIADATFSHPQGGEIRLTWDIKMADKAGLLSKDGTLYRKYPRAMLRSRLIAEGVRTIYPAATGGMLAKEEVEDIEEITDTTKSRVERIVESSVSEAEVVKQEVKEDVGRNDAKADEKAQETVKKDSKKMGKASKTNSDDKSSESVQQSLPEGIKQVIGLIDTQAQGQNGEIIAVRISNEPIINPNTGIASIKHSFLIDGKYYGTWDGALAKQIMECVDNRIMVKFEYKERPDPKVDGKFFQDIVSFKQATMDEVKV
jgi:hypothetical protein